MQNKKPLSKRGGYEQVAYGGRGRKYDQREHPLHTGTGYCCDQDYMATMAKSAPPVQMSGEYGNDLDPRISGR